MALKINKEGVIVVNQKDFDSKKAKMLEAGKVKLHILADFDRTLTKAFVNGESTPSVISELRKGDYISKEYAKKAQELADKYHPIEVDPNLSVEKKKKAMNEWWTKHFGLLIESGLNKRHIQQIIDKGKIQFRNGASEFLDLLYKNNIPLIIISSSGLGGDSIEMFLEKEGKRYSNIDIISNNYIWDENGNARGVKKPIIHVMNKDETVLRDYSFFENIKHRKNVILLGDSLGDIGMIEGFDYQNLIKIGFLNEDPEKQIAGYKKVFDVIIIHDGNFEFVNNLIKEFLKIK